jgi:hypothetical protein
MSDCTYITFHQVQMTEVKYLQVYSVISRADSYVINACNVSYMIDVSWKIII